MDQKGWITLQRRWEYLQDLEFNSDLDYNYRLVKNINTEELAKYVSTFNTEWYSDTAMSETYTVLKDTNAIMIAITPSARIDPTIPFNTNIVTEDKKLLELVMPIANDLASLYDGKYGRIWLAKLPANNRIYQHKDGFDTFRNKKSADFYYLHSVYRIHIPIITNDKVIFNVNNEEKHLKVGEAWDMNHRYNHYVENNGDRDRVHLAIDILPYKWL